VINLYEIFPEFKLTMSYSNKIETFNSNKLKGKWSIIFFYPEDFSFICPTEIINFEKQLEYLKSKKTTLIGISVDSVESHQKWQTELNINYPLLSDENGNLSKTLGILNTETQKSQRATFILNPECKVEFIMINSQNVGRSVEETIRVFDALLSGKICTSDFKSI
jgi:alkyl hydroperoxide reductase subunit AhpC